MAAGQSQRLRFGVGIFNWHHLGSPPQIPRPSVVDLELGGLKQIYNGHMQRLRDLDGAHATLAA